MVRLQPAERLAMLIAVAAVGLFFLMMLLWMLLALVFRRRFQFTSARSRTDAGRSRAVQLAGHRDELSSPGDRGKEPRGSGLV